MRPVLLLTLTAGLAAPAAADEPLVLPPTAVEAGPADYRRQIAEPTVPSFWATAEYLVWWTTPQNVPPLLVAVPEGVASAGGTAPAGSNILIFPTERLGFGAQSGGRFTVGYNLTCEHGFEVTGYVLESRGRGAGAATDGAGIAIARPYVAAATGTPSNVFASLRNQYVGGGTAFGDTEFWGIEANARGRTYSILASRNDALAGFKYLSLDESLQASSLSAFPDGSQIGTFDTIRTSNRYYGGQVGLHSVIAPVAESGFGVESVFKFGVGGVRQRIERFGGNLLGVPGVPTVVQPLGLLTGPANTGVFERSEAAVNTDVTVNFTYNFSRTAQVFFGYSLVYLSNVVRPGENIDPVVNDGILPFVSGTTPSPIARPAPTFTTNDFWAQGLNFGVRLQY